MYTAEDITIELLFKHPLGLVVSLLWVLLMLILIIVFDKILYPKNLLPRTDDKPLVAIKSTLLFRKTDNVENINEKKPDLMKTINDDYKPVIVMSYKQIKS